MIESFVTDKICFIQMNNPKRLNCLSEDLCDKMIEALDGAYNAECVGVVITAECSHGVWSAGHDIRELPQDGFDPLAFDVPMERLLRKVQDLPIPVIACVNGTVWGKISNGWICMDYVK